MKIDGKSYRTIWRAGPAAVEAIDQTRLPHALAFRRIDTLEGAVAAIKTMVVRGAPLIGATAAYGLAIALTKAGDDASLEAAYRALNASRPTAVNLRHALDDVRAAVSPLPPAARGEAAFRRADEICAQDIETNLAIGEAGFKLIEAAHERTGRPVNVLTHCNAGWLATVDWGTATAPWLTPF
jgi:methylthioribose-1-phosphate isomerase